jgi:hypothetical protein
MPAFVSANVGTGGTQRSQTLANKAFAREQRGEAKNQKAMSKVALQTAKTIKYDRKVAKQDRNAYLKAQKKFQGAAGLPNSKGPSFVQLR